MFTEPHRHKPYRGWMEVICGCMFSGKSEELIRRLRRAEIARQTVAVFKPELDTRYASDSVVSHDAARIMARPVPTAAAILEAAGDAAVVGIDEVQFFDEGLPDVLDALAARGCRVIAAGLDMDFLGHPFGPVPALLARAEHVTKLHAICMCCGDPASYSYRVVVASEQILLGEKDAYEPRCRACFLQGPDACRDAG